MHSGIPEQWDDSSPSNAWKSSVHGAEARPSRLSLSTPTRQTSAPSTRQMASIMTHIAADVVQADIDAVAERLLGKTRLERRVLCCSCVVLLIWMACVCMMLLATGLLYELYTTDQSRKRYEISSANKVAVRASAALSSSIAARDALDYAIQRKFYFEPFDVATVLQTLAPVMAVHPSVRAVELAFTTSQSIRVSRRFGYGPALNLQVQSDESTCLQQLGPLGCLSNSSKASSQSWYQLGLTLAAGQEAGNQSLAQAISGFEASFSWVDSPGFVPSGINNTGGQARQTLSISNSLAWTGGGNVAVAWAPAYSLIFRSLFPGTMGTLSVIGRVTIDVSSLSASGILEDSARIGPSGGVYICDTSGNVIASILQGEQALITSTQGVVRFRKAWELAASWASDLTPDLFSASATSQVRRGNFRITVHPFTSRGLGRFRVLLAAEIGAFADPSLVTCSLMGKLATGSPPIMFFLIWLTLRGCRFRDYLAEKRRVYDEMTAAVREEERMRRLAVKKRPRVRG